MRYLVTGGAGYLGSATCSALLEAGHTVVSVDLRRPPWADRLVHRQMTFLQADVLDVESYRCGLGQVDAVIHLSALSSDTACANDPDRVELVNTVAPVALARAALEEGVRRFVLASTCAVYGTGQNLTEEADCRPQTPYAVSKLRAESFLLDLRTDGLEPVLLRLGTLFGRAETPRHDLVVNAMVRAAVTTGTVHVNGTGRQWRPLVHVRDAAAAMRWAATRDLGGSDRECVLNVGGPDANNRVAAIAERVAEHVPGTVIVTRDGVDASPGYSVDVSRVGRAWCQHRWVALEEGLRSLVDGARTELNRPAPEQQRSPDGSAPAGNKRCLPLAVPDIRADDERAILGVLRSGWLARGRHADEFEARLREATGARHVVAVSSCTAALHLALLAAGVGPGDEVITTPLTWPATANVIEHVGAVPVFADVDPNTLNIDPLSVRALAGPRTRAVMPVHMAGFPADLDALRAIADEFGAVLVEDAAHALGASYEGSPIGTGSAFACFSFYPTKSITTVDGGALALDDEAHARTVRILANHGMTSTAWSAASEPAGLQRRPECLAPGYKYNVSDVAAALGVAQLRRLDQFVDTRERLVRRYRERLRELPGISLPQSSHEGSRSRSSYHLMPIIVDAEDGSPSAMRDSVMHRLRTAGITTGIHYRSLHLQPYYRDRYRLDSTSLPVAARLSDQLLSLPLHCRMGVDEVDRVVSELCHALRDVPPGAPRNRSRTAT